MTLQDIVPSLELCKDLRDAGFPQEGCLFYWVWNGNYFNTDGSKGFMIVPRAVSIEGWEETYAAPTSAEIGERLPILCLSGKASENGYNCWLFDEEFNIDWYNDYQLEKQVEALALTYLYLHQQGLLPQGEEKGKV